MVPVSLPMVRVKVHQVARCRLGHITRALMLVHPLRASLLLRMHRVKTHRAGPLLANFPGQIAATPTARAIPLRTQATPRTLYLDRMRCNSLGRHKLPFPRIRSRRPPILRPTDHKTSINRHLTKSHIRMSDPRLPSRISNTCRRRSQAHPQRRR